MDRVATDQKIKLAIADCDIHPTPKSVPVEIYPYLSKRWQDYMETYGIIYRQGFPTGPAFPKGQPNAARRDAYPPGGGRHGSDLAFRRRRLLEQTNVQLGLRSP